jgi:hypothetical protein
LPEWLVEQGIGETRAALVEESQIIEARIELDAMLPAGSIVEAKLISVGFSGRNGTALVQDGSEYLLPMVPRGVTEGATISVQVTRPAIPGPEPWKRALAKVSSEEPKSSGPLAQRLRSGGAVVRELPCPAAKDELGEAGWNDVIEEARTGHAGFAGGSLGLFPTPAMTLIDVDGILPASELMLRGAEAAAGAIRRLDIGGSIGIDLPTVAGKEARKAAADLVDSILPQPFERTAINGFGFLQIVRPRSRPSLLEIFSDRPGAEARALLRRGVFEGSGGKRLVAPPAVIAVLESKPEWLDAFGRQIGGAVDLRADPALPMSGGYAEKL